MIRASFVVVLLLSFAACARSPARGALRTAPLDPPAARAALGVPPQGELRFDDAVRRLVAEHPELVALRAEAASIDLDPSSVRIDGEMKTHGRHVLELEVGAEVLSLLGLGPRGARIALARAMRDEARVLVHERARARVGELAEAYAVCAALDRLEAPPVAPDVTVWAEGGYLTDALGTAVEGIAASLEVERAIRAIEVRRAREAISVLVGASPAADVVPVAPEEPWPPVGKAPPEALLLARGDLLRRVAALEVADRALRVAAQEQWPELGIRVMGEFDPFRPLQSIMVSIPLDAPRKVAFARRRRDAVARRLEEGVHAALAEAASAARDAEVAALRVRGIEADLRAMTAVVAAERARLETTPDALTPWIETEARRAMLWREVREARVDAARMRVKAAIAAGWPTAEEVRR